MTPYDYESQKEMGQIRLACDTRMRAYLLRIYDMGYAAGRKDEAALSAKMKRAGR